MSIVTIYTDGACRGNPGPGGWGALLIFYDTEKEIFGGERKTTNNRMELCACIEALDQLSKHCRVRLFTDSTYVKDGIQSWLRNWKRNNWKTAAKKPVKIVIYGKNSTKYQQDMISSGDGLRDIPVTLAMNGLTGSRIEVLTR